MTAHPLKRFRARGSSPERLERRTGRSYARRIYLRNLTCIEEMDKFSKSLRPPQFRISDYYGSVSVVEIFRYLWKFGDVLTLNRVAQPCATKHDVESLVEDTDVIDRGVGAVVGGAMIAL